MYIYYLNASCGTSTAAPYVCISASCCSCWRFGGCKLWVAVLLLALYFLWGPCFCYFIVVFCYFELLAKVKSWKKPTGQVAAEYH